MSIYQCPVCQGDLSESMLHWHFSCARCAYEKSSLEPTINQMAAHQNIDESAREEGLRALRISNFKKLLRAVQLFKPQRGRLLDVGCAHGWFLESAGEVFDVLGVEPDQAVYRVARARGLPVRNGYFPQALRENETFDVIVFNDVFEHIPAVAELLNACHDRLDRGGYLVVNLPSSDGLFYRLSRIFVRLGYKDFFERLWQKGLPSPHVHYFNAANLARLFAHSGFVPVVEGRLPVLSVEGLYTRISYTGTVSRLVRIVVYAGALLSLPLLRLFPSDIVYVIARKG